MATVIPQLPFDDFLNYDELTRYLAALQESRPEMCRLGSIGQSRDGRDIPLLTIGDCATSDPDQRPAFLIQGNIHAGELAGSHAALFTAQRLLEDAAASQLLARVTFHIVPRLNPDGAERVVKTTERIRSRTDHSAAVPNRLAPEDVDGDGQILQMRMEHPDGEFARDPQDERLLVQRRADSEAPFYRVFPEGIIHDWDGGDDIQVGAAASTGTATGPTTGGRSPSSAARATFRSASRKCGTSPSSFMLGPICSPPSGITPVPAPCCGRLPPDPSTIWTKRTARSWRTWRASPATARVFR